MKREDFLRSIAVDPAEVKRLEEEKTKAEAAKRAAEYRASLAQNLRAKTFKGTVDHWTGPPGLPVPKKSALASSRLPVMEMDRETFKPGYVPSSTLSKLPRHEPDDLDEPMEYEIRGTKSKLFDDSTGRRFVSWVIGNLRHSSSDVGFLDAAKEWLRPYALTAINAERHIYANDLEIHLEFSRDSATNLITGKTAWAHRFKDSDFY
jgi:hypothetical protein